MQESQFGFGREVMQIRANSVLNNETEKTVLPQEAALGGCWGNVSPTTGPGLQFEMLKVNSYKIVERAYNDAHKKCIKIAF